MNSASSAASVLARFGQVVFPRRLWIGLAVVGIAGLLVQPRPIFGEHQLIGASVALALIVGGLLGRAWAAGCAGRHTKEATIDAPQLVTGGPYAYVRNPIYLASIVLGFGMVALVGDPWLLLMHIGVCVLLYAGIVPAEEAFLREKFGEEYACYSAAVPRFLPRLRPWSAARPARFDSRALLDQVRLGLILVAIYAGLHFAAWLRS